LVPQVVERLGGKLEHEIVRKPIAIPFGCAVQRLGFDLVERRQIIVQNDLVPRRSGIVCVMRSMGTTTAVFRDFLTPIPCLLLAGC
jgi:hypothetical protein